MELTLLTYNVFLLVLYGIVAALSSLYYLKTKKNLYLYTTILFLFFILDDWIIFMTEFIGWFADFYNQIFMSIPTFKTIIYVANLFSIIQIIIAGLDIQPRGYLLHLLLIPCALVWMFIPMIPDSPMKVFIYYLPFQIATFVLSLYALYTLKKKEERYDLEFIKNAKRLAYWAAIFSTLITLEDAIVIFDYDVVTSFQVSINYRSITSDIMYIGFSVFAIGKLIQNFQITTTDANRLKEIPPLSEHSANNINNALSVQFSGTTPTNAESTEQYSKFFLFCKEYQFTTREQDIFALLLKNMNNQEISDELVISIGTAKTHVHNIFQKIGVSKRQQLLTFYDHYQPDNDNIL